MPEALLVGACMALCIAVVTAVQQRRARLRWFRSYAALHDEFTAFRRAHEVVDGGYACNLCGAPRCGVCNTSLLKRQLTSDPRYCCAECRDAAPNHVEAQTFGEWMAEQDAAERAQKRSRLTGFVDSVLDDE